MSNITIDRAVVEQALEALEHAARCVQTNYLPDQCGHDWDDQIAFLRAALAQQDEPRNQCGETCERAKLCATCAQVLAQQAEPTPPPEAVSEAEKTAYAAGWWAALAQIKGGGNLPPPLQVPNDVAATLTTTDIAWLSTHRLVKLWKEFGQMRWAGADEGWDRAIEAVRNRLNDECQAVMYWKLTADKSNVAAIELLQKMQGLKHE